MFNSFGDFSSLRFPNDNRRYTDQDKFQVIDQAKKGAEINRLLLVLLTGKLLSADERAGIKHGGFAGAVV